MNHRCISIAWQRKDGTCLILSADMALSTFKAEINLFHQDQVVRAQTGGSLLDPRVREFVTVLNAGWQLLEEHGKKPEKHGFGQK